MNSKDISISSKLYTEIAEKDEPTFFSGAKAFLVDGSMNIFLVFVPISIFLWAIDANEVATFVTALLAICPLAERLGFVTEQLALHTNSTIGGLLNVTFGNATELIVSVVALFKNYYRLVQLSLLGSILSNMLLVLGTAFWLGGLKNGTQHFRELTGQINSTVLMIGVMALMFPAIMNASGQTDAAGQLMFSRYVSIAMIIVYICYVYMELRTEQSTESGDSIDPRQILQQQSNESFVSARESLTARPRSLSNVRLSMRRPRSLIRVQVEEDDEEEEEDLLGMKAALFWLTVVTLLIALLSEILVGTIEIATEKAHINSIFVTTIVLPIIGNAAEHASGIIFGMKNKMDVAVSIAVGSSTQITVFVVPILVIIGWIANKPLDLNFHPYECFSVLLTVIIVTFAIQGGKSNWLVGIVLIAAYYVVALGFFIHNDELL